MLIQALTFRAVRSGNASVLWTPYNKEQSESNKNALSKEIYSRCFEWIVKRVNESINSSSASRSHMIGILDIFGFEIFAKNSFEQLCINFANEALQQHFNKNIFERELEIYKFEGIHIPDLTYIDNQDVLDTLSKKPSGLLSILDDECKVPQGSPEGFLKKLMKAHATNPRMLLKTGASDFGVMHYAGVAYTYNRTVAYTYNRTVAYTYNRTVVAYTYNRTVAYTYNRTVAYTYNRTVVAYTYNRTVVAYTYNRTVV